MKRGRILLFALTVVLVFSGVSHAALTTIGTASYGGNDYDLIYDNDQSLVWLDYTKSAASWATQIAWASGLGGSLVVTLDAPYTSTIDWSTGWRLPATDESVVNFANPNIGWQGPDLSGNYSYYYGYNMVNSELGYLFYESLGNLGLYATDGTNPQPGYGLVNKGPFSNLLATTYWSDTQYSPNPTQAWNTRFDSGRQRQTAKGVSGGYSALAVHPGEVVAVPVPGALLLLASGLTGLGVCRKRIRSRHK